MFFKTSESTNRADLLRNISCYAKGRLLGRLGGINGGYMFNMRDSRNPFVRMLYDDLGCRPYMLVVGILIVLTLAFFVFTKTPGEALVAKNGTIVTISYMQNGGEYSDTFLLRWNGERYHLLDQGTEGSYNVIIGDIMNQNGVWTLSAFRFSVRFEGTFLGREIGGVIRSNGDGSVSNFTLR